uniref:SWI/SNF complex component SNF12 isogeny n=2 Tax=Cajanus cajan TaxID=3821 RepID=A0A151U096_CAJCA|nr:SWI/SNF complex component SNF12 isogeny [Cajanus cajan]
MAPAQYPISQAHAIVQAQFQAQLQAHGLTFNPTAKRFPPKPPAPFKPVELLPTARRKRPKPNEKHLPEKASAILPESALYTQLLDLEARLDAALARKKVDIHEALKNPLCVQKTLRIFVFNTFSNQNRSEPPTWTLKIIGRVLDDGEDPDHPGFFQRPSPYPKFSAFFKRVTISLDKRLYPDSNIITWENSRSSATHEGFEVKRKGDQEFSAQIRLEMNYSPEKFMLSPALREVLGVQVDTRARIVSAIWHYVKARKLQNQSDPSFFHCDQPLQNVFGEDKVKFSMVSQKISHHLFPPQVILLEHKIVLSGSSPVGSACYDVMVDVPFPIQRELSALVANVDKNREVDACDESICGIIRKIHEHRRRRAFFVGFSQSPLEFIKALVESQNKDMKILVGESGSGHNADKERKSDFFKQPWVDDAIVRFLNRKPAVGSNVPGST